MKKTIVLFGLLLLSSCNIIDPQEDILYNNEDKIVTINGADKIDITSLSWTLNNDELLNNKSFTWSTNIDYVIDKNDISGINCYEYQSEININLCLDEMLWQINEDYFKEQWNNNCWELFDSSLYNKKDKELVEEFFLACEDSYVSYSDIKPSLELLTIEDCSLYNNESYRMYDDNTTWLTSTEQCKFEIAFNSTEWCEILDNLDEKIKCNEVIKWLEEYRKNELNKKYFEMFWDIK